MEERAHLARRVAALEAERTSWAARERELLHELNAARAELDAASSRAEERTHLEEGEMREAFADARRTSGTRRPRWADTLGSRDPDA